MELSAAAGAPVAAAEAPVAAAVTPDAQPVSSAPAPESPVSELDDMALEQELNDVTLDDADTFDDAALEAELEAALEDEDETRVGLVTEPGTVAVIKEEGSTSNQAFVNTFISFVGVGVLGLPGGFSHVGAVWGATIMASVAVTAHYAMTLLMKSKQRLLEQGCDQCNSFGDLAQLAFGSIGYAIVQSSILIAHTGFCCAYVIFVVENLHIMLGLGKNVMAACMIGAVMPLIFLKHLKYLTATSMLANIMNCSAFGIIFVFDIMEFEHNGLPELRLVEPKGSLYFVGIAVYCFEGIGLVLPLEASMENRSEFPRVLKLALIAITSLYLSFGLCGYCAYGGATESIITDNLPQSLVTEGLRVGMAIGLFFTYPMMMFPVSQIWDDILLGSDLSGPTTPYKQYLIRVLLGVITGFVARAVPDFGLFISLVGSSCCALLAFVMPAAIHLEVFRSGMKAWYEGVPDMLVVTFGVCIGTLGTYNSIMDIINASSSGHHM